MGDCGLVFTFGPIKTIALIGYSGYAHVVYDCFFSQGQIVTAYAEREQVIKDPFGLKYLGWDEWTNVLKGYDYFVSIADNVQRRIMTEKLIPVLGQPVIALHKTAVLSRNIQSGEGVMIGPRVIVNSGASLGEGVVVQSGATIEYGAKIGDYVSLGTGVIVGGNVSVDENTCVGAGAILAEGIKIGANCMIGEGCAVKKDVGDGTVLHQNLF